MPNIEEIKAFAEAEGFTALSCDNVGCYPDCPDCGDTGIIFVMHDDRWPPAAIAMMMADRARREEIAAAAKDASAALHRARGQDGYVERERGLNEVNQQLMKIWTKAQGARIE